ncbi:MAG TPA: hypothetical protein VJI97_00845 [Candidatus Nanoarchaeia archaeon]|nr:hypothetical protein [Candidatus Nanoarchaeia archaeon]
MKKRYSFFLYLLLSFLLVAISYAHGDETEYNLDHNELYPISQWSIVGYGLMALGVFVAVMVLFHKQMSETTKKIVYYLVAGVAVFVTVYLIIVTLHINVVSLSKGPVHWHADFEVWACDNELKLPSPTGMSNKQGVALLHSHDDNRIHVEGVIMNNIQASLGAYFYAVGGSLSSDGFTFPTAEGSVTMHEGNLCNGQPGHLYTFVNGNSISEPQSYAIAPHEKVPPGDKIKIIFTEKPIDQINPNIK